MFPFAEAIDAVIGPIRLLEGHVALPASIRAPPLHARAATRTCIMRFTAVFFGLNLVSIVARWWQIAPRGATRDAQQGGSRKLTSRELL